MSLVHATPRAATATSASLETAATLLPAPAPTPLLGDTHHLEHLERAVTIALAPTDYSAATAWGDALASALCALANADAGAVLLPGETVAWRAVSREEADKDEVSWRVHDEATERLHRRGFDDLVLWARDDLAEAGARPIEPTATGTIGIRVRTSTGAVAAICVHRDRALGSAPLQLIAAFRAIAPAFRSGVGVWVGANASRAGVSQVLDSLADPALLFDVAGALVHANPAAGRLTSLTEAGRLQNEAQRIAWGLSAMARRRTPLTSLPVRGSTDATAGATAVRTVQVAGVVYRLQGLIVGEHLLGAQPAVLVTMTTAAAEPLTDEVLEADYGLTARETQVARLIAEGLSNNEIAARLGVRFFTARNHVERTLAKFGVSSRQRVGPLLRNEMSEAGDRDRASAA